MLSVFFLLFTSIQGQVLAQSVEHEIDTTNLTDERVIINENAYPEKLITILKDVLNDVQIFYDNVPNFIFSTTCFRILCWCKVFQIDRDTSPKGIQFIIIVCSDKFTFCNSTISNGFRQVCRRANIAYYVIRTIDTLIETLPLNQEH